MSVVYGTPPGPKITNIYIGSLSGGSGLVWSNDFLNYLGSNYGYEIPVGRIVTTNSLSGLLINLRGQLNTLPWINLNCITVVFDQNVIINSGNLSISGVSQTYTITNFIDRGSISGKYYGSWFFNQSNRPNQERINADKIRIILAASGVLSQSSNAKLAGQIVNSTWTSSGDSITAAGEALPSKPGNNQNLSLRLNILPGNCGPDTVCSPADTSLAVSRNNRTTASGDYSPFVDINGDGIIQASATGLDRTYITYYLNISLPTGTI